MNSYKFNTYRKKNGELMLFLNKYNNGKNVCSLGISSNGVPSHYGKYTTAGQRKILDLLPQIIDSLEVKQLGEVTNPSKDGECQHSLGNFGDLVVTDCATVGGYSVGSDGAYLLKGNKCYVLNNIVTV